MKTIIDKFLSWFKYPPITLTNPATDKWDAKDKRWHCFGHAVVAFLFMLSGQLLSLPFVALVLIAVGTLFWTLTWGFQHELYDSAIGNGFSWKDLVANILGWYFGTVTGFIIGWAIVTILRGG